MGDLFLLLHGVNLLAVFCVLLFVSYVDLQQRIVKPECLALLALLWVVSLVLVFAQAGVRPALSYAVQGSLGSALVLAVLCLFSGMYEFLRKRESIGGGDIKLLAVFALFLGFYGALACLFLACVIALFAMLVKRAVHAAQRSRSNAFAFAPALCASAAFLLVTCWF